MSFVVALRSSSWTSPHSTGRTRLVLQPVRAANGSKIHQRYGASRLALAVALTHPVRPGCFQKTKQEVLGWWVGKEKLSSRSVGARSISAFCASSLAPKDRSAHSAPLVLFCCGTAGKLPLRLASGAPRLAGEGAHGNLSMISCRLCSAATLLDLRIFHSPRVGEWAKSPPILSQDRQG